MNKEAQTIDLTTLPPAPLTCLTASVNGTKIKLNTSGRLNVSNYFSPCKEQVLHLEVDTTVIKNKRPVLTKLIALPMTSIPGRLNLFYHELNKTVQVDADEGTLACAGNVLMIKTVAGSGTS